MNKRILCIVLSILMMLALTGCMGSRPAPTPEPQPTVTAPPTLEPTLPPTPEPTPEPTPAPTAEPTPELTPEPTIEPEPEPVGPAPIIYKHPGGEERPVGGSAVFTANAEPYDAICWVANAPDGNQITMDAFRNYFPSCQVEGVYGKELRITNLSTDMNGWTFFCAFGLDGAVTLTESAPLVVIGMDPQPYSGGGEMYVNCKTCGNLVPADSEECPACGGNIRGTVYGTIATGGYYGGEELHNMTWEEYNKRDVHCYVCGNTIPVSQVPTTRICPYCGYCLP